MIRTTITHAAAVVVGILIAWGFATATAPSTPTLVVTGVPPVITGQITARLTASNPVLIMASDDVDYSLHGTTLRLSADYTGPALIRIVAISGHRVSSVFDWRGEAEK